MLRKPDSIDPEFRLDLVASPPESQSHCAAASTSDGWYLWSASIASFR